MSSSSISSSSGGRWTKLQRMLSRPSYFGNETGTLPNGLYEPGPHLFGCIQSPQQPAILVVGAGGLGCEILKVHWLLIEKRDWFIIKIYIALIYIYINAIWMILLIYFTVLKLYTTRTTFHTWMLTAYLYSTGRHVGLGVVRSAESVRDRSVLLILLFRFH